MRKQDLSRDEFELPVNVRKATLPVHGFVLAGGKSSRMGRDKALLPFRGRPMVEIAVEKLRGFCTEVSIVGNRDDLGGLAPVVREARLDCGPAAGIEAGLQACTQPWAMFVPVDVPLVPETLLRRWAEATVAEVTEVRQTTKSLLGCSLYTRFGEEPAFAMLRPGVAPVITEWLDREERRLSVLLGEIGNRFGAARYLRMDAAWHAESSDHDKLQGWFLNVNTLDELRSGEMTY